MAESRTKNAKSNAISGLFNKAVVLFLQFVVRTVVIRKLGADYLGLDNLFVSVLQVLNLAELGFSGAITFSLYKPLAENNITLVAAYLTFFRGVYKRIGWLIFVGGILLMPFLPYLIKGSYPQDINLYSLFLIHLLNVVLSYLLWGYRSVLLSAYQKQAVIYQINTLLVVLRSFFQITLLFLFRNYYLYAICILMATVLNNAIIKVYTDKKCSQYFKSVPLGQTEKKAVTKQVYGVMIGKISNTARNSFDSIVLSLFGGLIPLAIYSNYYYVISAVLGIYVVLTESVAAGIGNSIAVESVEKNYNDFLKFQFLFGWIGSACSICMLCMYQPFMTIWVGDQFLVNDSTMFLFVIYFYILQSGQLRSVYCRAFGLWWKTKWLSLCEAVLNLLLNFCLGYLWGMNGILIATIITVSLFSIIGVTKVTINYGFKRSSTQAFKGMLFYTIITVVLGFVIYGLTLLLPFQGIVRLVVAAVISALLPNSIILWLSLKNPITREYIVSAKRIFLSRWSV